MTCRTKTLICFWLNYVVFVSKSPSFSGFSILIKNSLNDRASGEVALLISDSCLFSEVRLNTPELAVAGRVTLNKAVIFAVFIFLRLHDHVAKTDLINLIEQLLGAEGPLHRNGFMYSK